MKKLLTALQYDAANYMGIPGRVFCAGSDCMVEGDIGSETLTGSWYFTPDEGDEWYVKLMADVDYTKETLYAEFGHWLTGAADDGSGNTEVNTFASSAGDRTAFRA